MHETVIGIIADTHGLLRTEAVAQLRDCDHILHAGDIGNAELLHSVSQLAPTTAIRGNIDHWASELPDTAMVDIAGWRFYLLHDLKTLHCDPTALGIDVVISGHTHKPEHTTQHGVTYLNPGSAGRRRFKLPVTLAIVKCTRQGLQIDTRQLLD